MSLATQPQAGTEIVPITEGEQLIMANGIVYSNDEAEYRQYMDSLYGNLETGRTCAISTERTLMTHHPWHNVSVGESCPQIVQAVIEIPALSRVKTELDKQTGLLKVDRILHSSVIYPANYGFIPQSLAEDGDPLDILVLSQLSIPALSIVKARPIGVMPMVDNNEADDKIIAVAINDPEYNVYQDIAQLPPFKLLMINQFFNDYKTLERKEVKTFKPLGHTKAIEIIHQATENYKDVFQPK